MESSVATHSEEVAPPVDGRALLRATAWRDTKGRNRGSILARMLLGADVLAALTASMLGGFIVGLGPLELAILMSGATIAWPLIAFALGLYNGGTLRFWVSGVSEVPQALAAIVLFSWPLFVIATVSGAPAPGFAALWTVLLTALLSPLARASVRAKLHREAPLRQRALIVGSGVVAGQLVEKMRTHEQYGILPIGLVDDSPHEVGTPDLPRLGDLGNFEEVIREYGIDRVVIAFSQAGHEELLHCIRVCRDEGVAVDVVPAPVRVPRRGPVARPGRRHAAALDRRPPPQPLLEGRQARASTSRCSADLILLLMPLIAAIAVAIKLESRGPVFFRQPRAGRGGDLRALQVPLDVRGRRGPQGRGARANEAATA